MTFDPEGHLLLSDGRLAVHQYDLSTKKRLTSWAQQETRVYAFYDYVVNPLWKLLPRPGQLDRFAKWTLDGDQEVLAGEGDGPPRPPQPDNLLQDRDRFSPSQVLVKNGLFIAVLLALGCFYVQRNDF